MRRLALLCSAFILGALMSDAGEPLLDWPDGPLWYCAACGEVRIMRCAFPSKVFSTLRHTNL
jgi:hypothetical protein